jgi:CelD/BcsL family acetyltransferase involved in cellulose biosynthesis
MVRPSRSLLLRETDGSVIAFGLRRHHRLGPLLEPLESQWLFGCPLLGPDAVELLAAALAEPELRRLAPAIVVSALRPRSAQLRRLVAAFESRYAIHRLAGGVSCCASLDGGLEGFLARRSARLRKRLRQAERRANARGVTYERHAPAGAAEADAVYARMQAVERTSWKGIERCGMAERWSREFYGRLLRRLSASGGARVMFARAEGRDVGFIFGGVAGACYRGQQFSYADDWSELSIGNLLQLEQVRWLCEEGVARYDMGPPMEYKRHWTELAIPSATRLLVPSAAA